MPEVYVPILRDGGNERNVMRNFSQSSLTGEGGRTIEMAPVVEVTDADDLDQLTPYDEAGDFLMVELPQYLTDRSNEHQDSVTSLIDDYGSVAEFYLTESDRIDIPVISGSIDPVDYTEYLPMYRAVSEEFDRIGIRLMFQDLATSLAQSQRDTLMNLAEQVRDDDIVMLDLVDNRTSDQLLADLEFVADLFDSNLVTVLNAFDAYNGFPENKSPHIANRIGAAGFGDFGINSRFDPEGGFAPPTTKYRHYHPNHSVVQVFKGNGYEEASQELSDWGEFERTHCDGCRRADRTSSYDPNTWTQIKMEHYFSSVLNNEIQSFLLSSTPPLRVSSVEAAQIGFCAGTTTHHISGEDRHKKT